LDIDGTMALRLPNDLGDEFLARYESGPVVQYGSVMHGYVSVPADLLRSTDELREWFDKSYDWIGALEPKPTRK
jgi:TfoX/Sxy family transcriptional regulator of competence genes